MNQDGTINAPSSPAAAGSVVTLFATGAGQTIPPSITGSIPVSAATTDLPITVTIGGVDAPVQYHGSAPGEITGLVQINAVVPQRVTPGPAVPVIATVGGKQSQAGVTIAIR